MIPRKDLSIVWAGSYSVKLRCGEFEIEFDDRRVINLWDSIYDRARKLIWFELTGWITRQHYDVHESFSCRYCPKSFESIARARLHLVKKHDDEAGPHFDELSRLWERTSG